MKLGKAISTRLKALREVAGLSQQEVAVRADLSLSLVAKLEQGKKGDPRASTLVALALALGVRPGELLDGLAEEAKANAETNGTTAEGLPEGGLGVVLPDGNGEQKPARKGKESKKKKKKKAK